MTNHEDDKEQKNIDIFRGLGIKIKLKDKEDFLKIAETLTRMGIASRVEKALYQSCNILHKRGEYAILHFKEMFILDGKEADLSEEDIARRNTIANMLAQWQLLDLVDPKASSSPVMPLSGIKIISHKEKKEGVWILRNKYRIGSKKKY